MHAMLYSCRVIANVCNILIVLCKQHLNTLHYAYSMMQCINKTNDKLDVVTHSSFKVSGEICPC